MNELYLQFYKKGFLPGPKESKEAFLKRISVFHKISSSPNKYITEKSLRGSSFTPVDRAYLLLKNSKKTFFQAASTIILEVEKQVYLPVIRGPSKFSALFVNPKEVMAHEEIHARRAQFDEPKFEETLAYRSSKSLFRRYVSPVVSTNKQTTAFLLSIGISQVSLLPLYAVLAWCSVTNFFRQRHIFKCLDYLSRVSKYPEEILMAMADDEIIAMSKGRLCDIDFNEFRWLFLEELFGQVKKSKIE